MIKQCVNVVLTLALNKFKSFFSTLIIYSLYITITSENADNTGF